MNALSLTRDGMISALTSKQRVAQTVHISTRAFSEGRMSRALVLVVPEGAETGEYFEVFSERTLEALMAGSSPEYLELEPYEPDGDADADRWVA